MNIFTRSPYLAIVDNGSTNSKVELFLWNFGTTEPTSPTRTLTKVAPSLTITRQQYNISPYIREYIRFNSFLSVDTPSVAIGTNVLQYCFCRVKVYGNNTLISNTLYTCFDGYTNYTDNLNFDNGDVLLDEDTYQYYAPIPTGSINRAGNITIQTGTGWTARYTNLVSGSMFSFSLLDNKVIDIYRVYRPFHEDGNKVEILDGSSVVQKTFYFTPIDECRYTPVVVDFINKYGAWQREFFFKASNEKFEVQNTTHKMLTELSSTYQLQQGQIGTFNSMGKNTLTINSGDRRESFFDSLKQLMLSEKVLMNELPAKLVTNSLMKFKSVNTKMFNYTIEVESAYDENNTVQ